MGSLVTLKLFWGLKLIKILYNLFSSRFHIHKCLFRLVEDKLFKRIGDDLYTNVTISLEDALTGFSTTVTHLDGHIVNVKRDAVTWSGFKMRIRNEGMPTLSDNTKVKIDQFFAYIDFHYKLLTFLIDD